MIHADLNLKVSFQQGWGDGVVGKVYARPLDPQNI